MNDSDHGLNLEFNLPADPTPHVDADQLNAAIRQILHGADLEQLSRRMIRKQLETQFNMDLSVYKDMINECILRVIEEQQADEEDEDEEPEPSDGDDEQEVQSHKKASTKKKAKATAPAKKASSAAKRKRGSDDASSGGGSSSAFNMKLSLSPELAEVVGADSMARPQIVKALWEYIRENNLQDPNNKRVIILDERMRNVFQRDTVTMFSMNKFMKRHVRKPEELPPGGWSEIHRDGLSSDDDDEEKPAKKKPAAKKKKKAADDDDDSKPKKNPFNAELSLSPELALVVGTDRLARPQIVKQIWEYIRAHNLQDPSDKRTILLDYTLRQVFQRDTVTMFSINKYIKRHAMKPENLPAGGWAEVPRDGASSDEDEESTKGKKKSKK